MTREQIIETMARGIFSHWQFQAGNVLAVAWVAGGNSTKQGEARDYATAALSALEAAGFVVVPVEPTDKMIDAAIMADRPPLRKITVGDVLKAEYTAMVKAALNPERDSSG